jgi:hypothetical protein
LLYRLARRLLFLTLSLWAARAEAAKVVLVSSVDASPVLSEARARLQGEVQSLGIEVALIERPSTPSEPKAWVERMGTERLADAVIEVGGDAGRTTVDIWIFERATSRWEVSHVALEPNAKNAAERLAIRAIETLRAGLVEIARTPIEQRPTAVPQEPPALVTQRSLTEPSDEIERFDLQAGVAVLSGRGNLGPSLMPIVRAGWTARSWLVLQGTLAGFGSRPIVTSAAGSARVSQQYAVVGGSHSFREARTVQPCVALSAGVLRTTIDGQADMPAYAHFVERWGFLLEGTLGTRLRLSGRYHLTVAAHVQVAVPYLAIHLADTLAATAGNPNVVVSLTLGGWL